MQKIAIREQELILHHHKAIFWEREKMLVIADFHIGKSAHFRRNGIPVHSGVDQINIKNLHVVLKEFNPQQLVFLGDLFHNRINGEWTALKQLLSSFESMATTLVLGNHDMLSMEFYGSLDMKVVKEAFVNPPFVFSHKPLDSNGFHYCLAGHVHPGILLKGKAKQYERLPCFHFNQHQGLVPAFGGFTGLSIVRPKKHDLVYVVTGTRVLPV